MAPSLRHSLRAGARLRSFRQVASSSPCSSSAASSSSSPSSAPAAPSLTSTSSPAAGGHRALWSTGSWIDSPKGCRAMSSAHVSWDYRGQRQFLPLGLKVPDVAVDAFVAPNAFLAGEVIIQDKASVWYGVVMRGDLNLIRVGPWSNVGDRSVVHAGESSGYEISAETDIGKYVTVGPYCTLRSCMIENEVVLGQRCVVMEGSIIEKNAMLASGSVVPPGRRIPGGEVWAGNPARFVREVTDDEIALIPKLAEGILEVAKAHASQFLPYSTAYLEVEKLLGTSKLTV